MSDSSKARPSAKTIAFKVPHDFEVASKNPESEGSHLHLLYRTPSSARLVEKAVDDTVISFDFCM